MTRWQTLSLLGGLGLALLTPLCGASAAGIETCARALEDRGYNITSMDIDDGRIYDFEAIKNNHHWDIKTDFECQVLLEKIDH